MKTHTEMRQVTVYTAEDGTEFFSSEKDAAKKLCTDYEESLNRKEELVKRFWQGYNGQQLIKKYAPNEPGIWRVEGEDPNPDFSGHHYNPYIATLTGPLDKVVEKAVQYASFFTWGAGGNITKVDVEVVK